MSAIIQNRQEHLRFLPILSDTSIFGGALGNKINRATGISGERTSRKLGQTLPDVLQDALLFIARALPAAERHQGGSRGRSRLNAHSSRLTPIR
jgi:hypothetical protein